MRSFHRARRPTGLRAALPAATVLLLLAPVGPLFAQNPRPAPRPKGQDLRVLRPAARAINQTWVKTGFFNEIDQTQRSAATINEPATLRFLWGTSVADAEEGFWRLRRKTGASSYSLVATGVATSGRGGRFDVDLAPFLPASPSADAALYHLEVVPRARSKTDATATTSPGQTGPKIAAKELGPWSAPVVITYAINPSPATRFDMDVVYRKATLVLDRIIVVADQDGPGEEEYRLAGFVQELQRACAGTNGQPCPFTTPVAQRPFGPYRRDLNPPAEAPLGWTFDPRRRPPIVKTGPALDFTLGSGTNKLAGQRRFVLTVSLIEEDAGSSMDDWWTGVSELGDVVKDGSVLGFDRDDVEEYLSDHAADAIRYVADGLQILSTIADIGAAAPIVGTGVAVAAFVVASILEDMKDDYYGTRAAYLTLESNRARDVHSLPGRLVGQGSDRRYVLKPQTLQFKGPPSANAASAFDGVVDIEFHWEFSRPEPE